MIMLVNGATQTVRRYAGHPHLGRLTQPESGNDLVAFGADDCDKGADNNCLQGFDLDRWMAMCEGLRAARRLRFVAAPDAVELTPRGPRGSWEGTLWLFRRFAPWLRSRGLPVAIVSQDGAIVETVPWDAIDALFVGGSDAHKCGPEAAYLIAAAKRRGKWVHVGRVNSKKRIDSFRTLGWLDGFQPDSFDGGQFSMFPDTYIPQYLDFLGQRTFGDAT